MESMLMYSKLQRTLEHYINSTRYPYPLYAYALWHKDITVLSGCFWAQVLDFKDAVH